MVYVHYVDTVNKNLQIPFNVFQFVKLKDINFVLNYTSPPFDLHRWY